MPRTVPIMTPPGAVPRLRYPLMVGLIAASTFGPYLAAGIRTEQALVYTLAVVLLPIMWARIRLTSGGATMLAGWSVFLAVATVVWSTGGALGANPWGAGSTLSGLDSLLLPVAAFLLVSASMTNHAQYVRALRAMTATVTVGMCLNAVIELGQFFVPGVVNPLLVAFWGSGGTAERALTLDRFTGFGGQPSVTGILYSVALLCALYVLRDRSVLRALAITILVIGGLLTLSKGFMFGGLPIAAWQIFRTGGKGGQRVAVVGFVLVLYYTVTSLGFIAQWRGIQRITYLLPGGGATLSDYSGNRYGSAGSSTGVIDTVLAQAPWGGYGLAGVHIATDTAFVHALVLAGLIGVLAVLVVTFAPLAYYVHHKREMDGPDRRLLSGMALVLIIVSLGAPALVVNRASVLEWGLFAILLSPYARTRARKPDATSRGTASRGPVASEGTGRALQLAERRARHPNASSASLERASSERAMRLRGALADARSPGALPQAGPHRE